ncbi:PEPxxWA-CTERM sorting domain-containing protein [Sandaracinobacter sp. RS1-74]|uniref:PEPxxWA-CTERM sorting domain-containing protein n=1 Tax=Sandaracinobacteroides sayramensis TaxID=2913411 RepID=UPI001EDBA47C|nr:PEPxxWA-CTERM sorting domain-containing protein [Sandaracinobacteroides sayramensis]MCG2841548.1 PEPxxWA-CTERM sorting domain-containing protein [Sandaracinobacteroides sayramensis]
MMKRKTGFGPLGATALLGSLLMAAPAFAGTIGLSGTRHNITPPGVNSAACGGGLELNFGPDLYTAGGTSNLGQYTYTATHCIAAPPPGTTFDGVFEWTFASGGSIFGTDYSVLTVTETPGLFDVVNYLTITGGSGRFADASGWITAIGTVAFGGYEGQPASFGNFTFEGSLTAPGIPEPASWAMMIGGFGLVGAAVRRRRVQACAS